MKLTDILVFIKMTQQLPESFLHLTISVVKFVTFSSLLSLVYVVLKEENLF